jgi:hypothetical protein
MEWYEGREGLRGKERGKGGVEGKMKSEGRKREGKG